MSKTTSDLLDPNEFIAQHVNTILLDTHNLTIAATLGERVTLSRPQVARIAIALTHYLETRFFVCPIRHDFGDNDETDNEV